MTRDFIQSAQVGEGGRKGGRRAREGGREGIGGVREVEFMRILYLQYARHAAKL